MSLRVLQACAVIGASAAACVTLGVPQAFAAGSFNGAFTPPAPGAGGNTAVLAGSTMGGWTVTTGEAFVTSPSGFAPMTCPATPAPGVACDFTNAPDAKPFAQLAPGTTIDQAFTTQSGTMYTLTYQVAVTPTRPTNNPRPDQSIGLNFSPQAGTTPTPTGAPAVLAAPSGTTPTWVPETFTFTATSSQSEIQLATPAGNDSFVLVDDVMLTQASSSSGQTGGSSSGNITVGNPTAITGPVTISNIGNGNGNNNGNVSLSNIGNGSGTATLSGGTATTNGGTAATTGGTANSNAGPASSTTNGGPASSSSGPVTGGTSSSNAGPASATAGPATGGTATSSSGPATGGTGGAANGGTSNSNAGPASATAGPATGGTATSSSGPATGGTANSNAGPANASAGPVTGGTGGAATGGRANTSGTLTTSANSHQGQGQGQHQGQQEAQKQKQNQKQGLGLSHRAARHHRHCHR